MEPYLQYLLLSRDVINDKTANDYSALRIFDTVWIGANDTSVVYTFHILGRLMLNQTGSVNLSASVSIKNPAGTIIRTEELGSAVVDAGLGVNLHALALAVLFESEGRYSVDVNVRVNDGALTPVGPVAYFWVKKLPPLPQIT